MNEVKPGPAAVSSFSQILASKATTPRDVDMTTCVKLRNMEFAIDKLEEMYKLMNVSSLNQTSHPSRPCSDMTDTIRGAFRVHVVSADNMKSVKGGLANPFVVIRVPEGTGCPSPVSASKEPMKGPACELLK